MEKNLLNINHLITNQKENNMNKIIILFVVLFIAALTGEAYSSNSSDTTKTKKTENVTTKKIWNAVCPIMGDEVDPKVATVEYNGKTIGFCCKSCIKKFNKDPEKYMKNLSEDGKKFIKKK